MPLAKFPKIPKNWGGDLRKLPIVELTWVDATVHQGWFNGNQTDQDNIEVITTGRFLPPTKTQIKLLFSITSDGGFGYMLLVPKVWVKKVKVLK